MADVQSNIDIRIDTSSALASIKLLQSQLSAFQTSMSKSSAANAAAAANMQQNLINNINATGKFNASVKTVKTTTESFTNALEKNKLSLGQYFKYATASSKSFGSVFKNEFETINKVARERVKDLQTQYIKLGRDASGAMKAIAVRPLALDMDNLGTKTAIAAQRQQLLNQMLKQGSTNLLNFGKNTQWAGRQLMVGFSIPIGMAGAAAAKAYMEIEKASVKIKRVYGDLSTTAQETNNMVEQIKTLATEYTKYGIAVADTMDMAAKAAAMGKTGADLLAQVGSASKLAALGGVDQAQALDTTISLTNAFGLSADKLTSKINFLNAVENQTVTSIEDLTIAIPKAGPVIQQLGGNVEDLAFFLTAMREGGINASEGANALKSGLASLINPTGKAAEMLASYGINVEKIVSSNKGDVKKTVIDFAKALDTLDPLTRARAIEQMFGKFQFARMSTLFQNVVKEGSQASKALQLANMSSIQLAAISARELKKLESSPMYKFQKAMADLQTKLAPVGETFLKAVTPVIDFVSKILEGFNGMSDSFKQFAVVGTAVAGVVAPALLMLVGLVANGAANIIKLFANIKSFFNSASTASNILGEETRYMTQEQINAAAVAASLDQTHSKLIQTFTSEAAAVKMYADELGRASTIAAAFNVPGVSRVRPKGAKKFASGGMVPGSGTGDTVASMLTPGEFVVKKAVTKKALPFLQALNGGKIKGFSNGGLVPGFTNAVAMLRSGTNQALKGGGIAGSALGAEFGQLGAGINAPIVAAIAQALGAKNNRQIVSMLQNDPSLREFATSITTGVANELSQVAGNVDDPKLGAIYQKVARAEAQKRGELYASTTEKFFTELTTFEDTSQQRIRSSGRSMSIGRATLFKNTPSYRSKNYSPVISELGTNPAGLVKAHMTERKMIDLSQIATAGKELSNQAVAAAGRLKAGIVKTYQSTTAAIVSGAKEATKTASPSKETANVGRDIGQGFINGGKEKIDDAKVVGQQLGDAVTSGATQSGGVRRNPNRGRATRPAGQTIDGQFYPVGFRPSDGYDKPAGPQMSFRQNVKRKYNLIKSGKATISGGKIAGAGFGASLAMGAASMIPGPIGQFAATLSPIIGIVSMFGGVISKILPVLLRFAGPIGLAITAIGGLVTIVNMINDAKKREKEKTNAVADAADLAGKALSGGLAKSVGLSGTNNLLNAAVGKAKGMNVSQVNDVNTLLQSDEFKNKDSDTGKFIAKLKTVGSAEAAGALLDSVAMGLLAQGATDQVVTDTITAIKIAAGKKDLQFDVRSIKLGTTAGQANLKKSVSGLVGEINKYASDTKTPTRFYGRSASIASANQSTQNYDKLAASAKAYGSIVSQVAMSVSQMFASGQISAKDFHASLNTLSSGFGQLSGEAQKLAIAQAFKNMDPAIIKVKDSLKNTTDQMKYLLLVSMGGSIEQSVIDQLNSSDAKVRAQGQKNLEQGLADAEKYMKEINKIMGKVATPSTSSSSGPKATNLKAQLAENIAQTKLARQLMLKGATADFAEFLSKMDKVTRAQYLKAGTNTLNAAGKALQQQYATKGLEEFKTKQATIIKGFKEEKTTRDALVAANLNYLDAAKAATDETVRAAMASALAIKNDILRKKAIQEVVNLIKIMNGEQAKADMSTVNTGQVQSIRDSYNQVTAYDKLIKAGADVKSAYDAVQDAATASALAQETNTDVITQYIRQARILQALQQKAKGPDQAKMDYANLKIDVKQAQANTYQDALSLLQSEEQKINDVYDKRIAALDEIIAANEKIAAQQQGQLDLASALSKGDMAAAAKAAMDMRQKAAKTAVDEQKKLLSDAKDAQINSLVITVNGQSMTMKMLNEKITALTNDINTIKLNEVDPAAQNIAQKALDNAIVPGTEDAVIEANGGLQGLIVDKPAQEDVVPVKNTTPVVSKKPATVVTKPKTTTTKTKVVSPVSARVSTAPVVATRATTKMDRTGGKIAPVDWNAVGKSISTGVSNAGKAVAGFIGNLFGFAEGGMVPKYLATGGPSWARSRGTDTIPAMLSPGEFVIKRSAVENFGPNNLKAINEGTYSGNSVYNYSINVNAGTNASTDDIARAVMAKIKQVDSQRIRGNTF